MGLKELGFKNLKYLMHPGIYVLCLKEEVVYVGQTINIFNRLADEDHKLRAYDQVYFVRCSMEELDRVESLMILKLRPRQNQVYNFNNNTHYSKRPVPHGPGQATHIITVKGVELSLKGRRRI